MEIKLCLLMLGTGSGGRSKAIAIVSLCGNLQNTESYFVRRVTYILYSKFLLLSIYSAVLNHESQGPQMYFATGPEIS